MRVTLYLCYFSDVVDLSACYIVSLQSDTDDGVPLVVLIVVPIVCVVIVIVVITVALCLLLKKKNKCEF